MEHRYVEIGARVARELERERLVVGTLRIVPEEGGARIWINLTAVWPGSQGKGHRIVGDAELYPRLRRVFPEIQECRCEFYPRVRRRKWQRVVQLRVPDTALERFRAQEPEAVGVSGRADA